MDDNNREISFNNAYIVLTTNAGSEIYKTIAQYEVDDKGSGKNMKKYDKLIRDSISGTTGDNRFPPELLGRIDTIVPFQPLSEATQYKIVETKLKALVHEVRLKHNKVLKMSKRVIEYLVKDNMDTDSNAGGARAVISKMEAEVTTAVARYINEHPDHDIILLEIKGKMAWEHKDKLLSDAYVYVTGKRSSS